MAVARSKKRADILRERRRKEGRPNPAPSRKKGGSTKRTAAPTVVRTRSMAVSSGSKKRKQQARQRKYLPLTTKGAELRLPAIPAIKFGWRLLSGPMVLALSFGLYTFISAPQFRVSNVEVAGLERISSIEINAVLGIQGVAIFSLTPQSIEQNLRAAFPELTELDITITFPAQVKVEAAERRPVIAWIQEDFSAWVDQYGIAFRERGASDNLVRVMAIQTPTLPETATPVQDQILTPEMVDAILMLNLQVPAGTDMLYHPEHGLGWQDPQGWQVFFGHDPDDMETRMSIYAELVKELVEIGIKPVMISMEFLHAPYYRLVEAK